jgi:hypothetical protein
VDELSPDRLFDRRWAITVITQAMDRLRAECVAKGNGELFEKLAGLLSGEKAEAPYSELAVASGLTEGAVKVTVHRCGSVTGVGTRRDHQTVGTVRTSGTRHFPARSPARIAAIWAR